MQATENRKPTPEESFRSSLDDLVVIAEGLSPYCETVQEFIGLCRLALDNDAQCRLLLKQVSGGQTRR